MIRFLRLRADALDSRKSPADIVYFSTLPGWRNSSSTVTSAENTFVLVLPMLSIDHRIYAFSCHGEYHLNKNEDCARRQLNAKGMGAANLAMNAYIKVRSVFTAFKMDTVN